MHLQMLCKTTKLMSLLSDEVIMIIIGVIAFLLHTDALQGYYTLRPLDSVDLIQGQTAKIVCNAVPVSQDAWSGFQLSEILKNRMEERKSLLDGTVQYRQCYNESQGRHRTGCPRREKHDNNLYSSQLDQNRPDVLFGICTV